jgi:mannosyl-oligosaccharide alpha-1,2-mannosidase
MNRLFQRWLILFVIFTIGLYSFFYYKDLPSLFRASEPHHIDWSKIPQKHPAASLAPLPGGAAKRLPAVQAAAFSAETDAQKAERHRRRDAVRDTFLRSWKAYRRAAWGHDEISPLSGSWKDHFGGWGATLVDGLDGLLLMGLDGEFADAVRACADVDFSVTHVDVINVFETTVRFLGGLLSAHEMAAGKDGGVLLRKARELGEMLYHSFDTVNRMPIARWAWKRCEKRRSYAMGLT